MPCLWLCLVACVADCSLRIFRRMTGAEGIISSTYALSLTPMNAFDPSDMCPPWAVSFFQPYNTHFEWRRRSEAEWRHLWFVGPFALILLDHVCRWQGMPAKWPSGKRGLSERCSLICTIERWQASALSDAYPFALEGLHFLWCSLCRRLCDIWHKLANVQARMDRLIKLPNHRHVLGTFPLSRPCLLN